MHSRKRRMHHTLCGPRSRRMSPRGRICFVCYVISGEGTGVPWRLLDVESSESPEMSGLPDVTPGFAEQRQVVASGSGQMRALRPADRLWPVWDADSRATDPLLLRRRSETNETIQPHYEITQLRSASTVALVVEPNKGDAE